MKCAGQDSGICEDEARGKALREYLEKTSRKTMTTTDTPNAAERPSDEFVAAWRAKQISRTQGCAWDGLSEVQKCYWRDEYVRRLEPRLHPAESVSADYPECSGDPACCPENEGFGCCKPNPQPSTPGAVSDEDVKQWRFALERAIESQRLLAEGIDKDNPEDPWASLLVHEDVAQLGNLATALESFAKRSAAAKGDEAVAVDFYSRNPSAALVDFTKRVAPPAQAVSVPDTIELSKLVGADYSSDAAWSYCMVCKATGPVGAKWNAIDHDALCPLAAPAAATREGEE